MDVKITILLCVQGTYGTPVFVRAYWRRRNGSKEFVRAVRGKPDLAEITGKRPSQVTCWLSGSHNFTLATIALISKALDIDLISIP